MSAPRIFVAAALVVGFATPARALNVGYFDMCQSTEEETWQVPPILAAGHTPVWLLDLTTASLAGMDIVFVTNCDNVGYSYGYSWWFPQLEAAVAAGRVLVIHDRYVDRAETILPGGAGFDIVRDLTDATNIQVLDPTTLVTNGPGGIVDDTTLDGGNLSSHGWAASASLPADAARILTNGDPSHIVTFSYRYGEGSVVYSTIPLDYYLEVWNAQPAAFKTAYAPNVIAYAAHLIGAASTPIANAGPDQSVDEGVTVSLDGSASSAPAGATLAYAWRQVSGPSVILSGADTARPSLVAPYLDANAVLTFELIVSAGGPASAPDTVDVVVKQVNRPPVADAGAPGTIREGAQKTLDATKSYDPDGDPIVSYGWTQVSGPPVVLVPSAQVAQPSFVAPIGAGARVAFSVVASDGKEVSAPAFVTIDIVQNSAPVADAGMDQTRDEGGQVHLNGSASQDPDGDGIAYAWTQVSGPSVTIVGDGSAVATFTAPFVASGGAVLVFQLAVRDDDPYVPRSSTDEVVVTIRNVNDPPSCRTARPTTAVLWPPGHKLTSIGFTGVTDPDTNGVYKTVAIRVTGVTQDEPTSGTGTGDVSPDAIVQRAVDPGPMDRVLLRAERADTGNGRVYTVRFVADDGFESCSGAVTVSVPTSSRGTATDDGQLFDSTLP